MKFILILLSFLSISSLFAQDTIVKLNGQKIESKVLSIGTAEVSYKKFENLEGPTYVIMKNEVSAIKYENGTSDLFNEIKKSEEVTEKKPEPKKIAVDENDKSVNSGNYIDKVRAIQAKDPSFAFYAGNGFLGGQGILAPLVGIEFHLPRKNVFVRGISVGARASFTGLGEAVYERQSYTEIYGYGLALKYYAPLPIKVIQPYFVTVLGGAMRNYYVGYEKVQFSTSYGWMHNVTTDIGLYSGFGLGCNFMFLNHFGGFVEMGYFTTSYINLGLTIKIGPIVK